MNWSQILINTLLAGVGAQAVTYGLAAAGLNVQFGYTGLLNFGQAAFLAAGGYGLAVSVASYGLPFWAGILIGLAAAAVLAVLLGIPTLRLRADYLAIVTIAAAEILRYIFRAFSVFGKSDGLQQFNNGFYKLNPFGVNTRYGVGSVSFRGSDLWPLLVGWIVLLLVSAFVFVLMRSPWGRVVKAIREDEDAVRSLGKNVLAYKMQALILGGVIGALGGFMYAIAQRSVQPDVFGTETTFFAYAILILGGAARVGGPIVGAMIFWALLAFTDNALNQASAQGYIPNSILPPDQVGNVRYILVGVGLILLMIFRPQGIFGDRRELAIDAR